MVESAPARPRRPRVTPGGLGTRVHTASVKTRTRAVTRSAVLREILSGASLAQLGAVIARPGLLAWLLTACFLVTGCAEESITPVVVPAPAAAPPTPVSVVVVPPVVVVQPPPAAPDPDTGITFVPSAPYAALAPPPPPQPVMVVAPSDQVAVYYRDADVGRPFEVLAQLDVSDLGKFRRLSLRSVLPRLAAQAQSVGANAIIIDRQETIVSGIFSRGISVTARAIRVH
jgi:hypothetical protein